MSAIITFDDSLWPLVIIRAQGTPTGENMKEYQARSLSYLRIGRMGAQLREAGW